MRDGVGSQYGNGLSVTRVTPPTWVTLLLLVGIGLVAVGCGASEEETNGNPDEPVRLLGVEAFEAFVADNPDADLINVHIPYEGNIAGTDQYVVFDQILDWEGLPEDRGAPVVLYCRSGNMSGQAARELANAGYTNIVDLDGGMNAWAATGRDLERDPALESG